MNADPIIDGVRTRWEKSAAASDDARFGALSACDEIQEQSRAMKHFDVASTRHMGWEHVTVRAGFRGAERIVPPAGEQFAFNRDIWAHEVGIYVSPAGRSVRLFIDGNEIEWPR